MSVAVKIFTSSHVKFLPDDLKSQKHQGHTSKLPHTVAFELRNGGKHKQPPLEPAIPIYYDSWNAKLSIEQFPEKNQFLYR